MPNYAWLRFLSTNAVSIICYFKAKFMLYACISHILSRMNICRVTTWKNETILVSLYEHDNNSDISAKLEEISRKTLMLLPDYLLK